MNEVQRILELVKAGRVSRDEAVKLLVAVAPRLAALSEGTRERLLALLDEDVPVADVAEMIGGREVRRAVLVGRPPDGGTRKTSRVMRLEVSGSDGGEVRVNLPLGLANFALKLIPRDAQMSLESKGLDMASLGELLRGDLPDGPLLEVQGSDGSEIRVTID